jgi:uncharacterized membrane protein
MTLLIVGLIVFFAAHMIPVLGGLRTRLVGMLGEGAYKGLFSLAALAGLVMIVIGFGQRDFVPVFDPPTWARHLAYLLMIPAFILLAAAYIPSRIRTATKHPMLAATKIWAFSHLLANGDLGSILLFGAFLAWAVIDRISVKRRDALGPLGARTGGLGGDVAAVGIGLAAYLAMVVWGHEYLIGQPLWTGVMIPS